MASIPVNNEDRVHYATQLNTSKHILLYFAFTKRTLTMTPKPRTKPRALETHVICLEEEQIYLNEDLSFFLEHDPRIIAMKGRNISMYYNLR